MAVDITKDLIPSVFTGTEVRIVDVAVPFWSMVGFLLKFALATIPAGLILGGVYPEGGEARGGGKPRPSGRG